MTHMDLTWPIEEFARGIEPDDLIGKPLKLKDREVGYVTHAERQVERHRFMLRVQITDQDVARQVAPPLNKQEASIGHE